MDEIRLRKAQGIWGWTDEQTAGLSAKQLRLIGSGEEFRQWRLIAEVLEAKNCIAGLKKGDKYVFHGSGFLLPEESTCPRICLWAIAAFIPFSFMLYDRIGQGSDPSEFWVDKVRCMDVGVQNGGYGEALFRLYCKKEETLPKTKLELLEET